MKIFFQIATLMLTLAIAACNNNSEESALAQQLPNEYQDFAEFYKRFHTDSAYQMEHIVFPLEGLPREADSLTIANNNFRWQRENWKIQRGFNLQSSSYEQELIPVSEGLIVEKIVHKAGGLAMQRRFARLGDEWYLIYYADLNRMRVKPELSIEGGF